MKLLSLTLALAIAASALPAAPASRDLGMGLSYLRIHELSKDMPDSARAGALVLDLRYAQSDAASAAGLGAWVKARASRKAPLFILENQETAKAIPASIPSGLPGVFILAPASAGLNPDISVVVSPASDRQAYLAGDKEGPLDGLLRDYPDKPRRDEAYLDAEHLSDSDVPESEGDKKDPPMPLVDSLLQRAVQLHRGLLALRRL